MGCARHYRDYVIIEKSIIEFIIYESIHNYTPFVPQQQRFILVVATHHHETVTRKWVHCTGKEQPDWGREECVSQQQQQQLQRLSRCGLWRWICSFLRQMKLQCSTHPGPHQSPCMCEVPKWKAPTRLINFILYFIALPLLLPLMLLLLSHWRRTMRRNDECRLQFHGW